MYYLEEIQFLKRLINKHLRRFVSIEMFCLATVHWLDEIDAGHVGGGFCHSFQENKMARMPGNR
jgi:hypothetical protein